MIKSLRVVVALAALFLMAGCSSLQFAGNASYSVQPIQTPTGVICCDVQIRDGKERASLDVHVAKTADGAYDITLSEKAVSAFAGQQISATAMQSAIDAGVKAALAAPLAPGALSAVAAGGVSTAVAGAAAGVAADKLLTPAR